MIIKYANIEINLVKITDSLYKAIVKKNRKVVTVESVTFAEFEKDMTIYVMRKVYQYA